MKWALVVLVALAAVIAANVVLLSFGGDRNDPVGQLSPVASLQAPVPATGHERSHARDHHDDDD